MAPSSPRPTEIVAERWFELTTDTGSRRLCVAVRKPVPLANPSEGWCCAIEIDDLDRHFSRTIFGADSLQALTLALKMLQVYEESWREWYGSRLIFEGHDL